MLKYNPDGSIQYPNAGRCNNPAVEKKIIQKCYCPEGHMLINTRVKFGENAGILVKVRKGEKEGLIAISPVCGNKSRISIDVDLVNDEIWQFHCPECDKVLAAFSNCCCGATLIALFLKENGDFSDFIGICNRVGCNNAIIIESNELFSMCHSDTNKPKY